MMNIGNNGKSNNGTDKNGTVKMAQVKMTQIKMVQVNKQEKMAQGEKIGKRMLQKFVEIQATLEAKHQKSSLNLNTHLE